MRVQSDGVFGIKIVQQQWLHRQDLALDMSKIRMVLEDERCWSHGDGFIPTDSGGLPACDRMGG